MTRRALLAAAAPAAPPPPVDLFRSGQDGVHTYRIPALLETPAGVLLAIADARYDSAADLPGRIALVLRRSLDGGRNWAPQQILHAVPAGGVGDASLLLDPRTSRVWCFFAYGPPGAGFFTAQSRELRIQAITSDDNGDTWSPAIDLAPQMQDPSWQAAFVTSGTHFATSNGRFLLPLVVRDAQGVTAARNAYSGDGGRTWRVGAAIGTATDESKAIELADGRILQSLRLPKSAGCRGIAFSTDGGITFGPVTPTNTLPDPSCNAGLARQGKRLWLTHAASPTRREQLTLSTSANHGVSWRAYQLIHPGPAAYSTLVPLRSGQLALLYEAGAAIRFQILPTK
jgi:sialidase-1